jgi:arylsulfatase A-like enzyme
MLAHNHGIKLNENDEATLADVETLMLQASLQGAGYRTGVFGKYLNGWPLTRDPAGWDRWALSSKAVYEGAEWNIDGSVTTIERNSTPFLGERTLDFVHESEGLDDRQPWFAYVAFSAPHLPATVPADYADDPVPPLQRTPAMDEQDRRDKPRWVRTARLRSDREIDARRVPQLRSLIALDDQIDRIMFELEDMRELDGTLVVFTSDNGHMWGEHGLVGKEVPYLPSIHVPLLARWPGRVPAADKDRRLVGLLDLTPTILTAAGVPFPHEMDGTDLLGARDRRRLPLELWRGGPTRRVPTWHAVVSRRWIYVEYLDDAGGIDGREYYDLKADPYQLENVLRDGDVGNDPDIARLHDLVLTLASCVGDACVT